MVKLRWLIYISLILFFLGFSFYPTYFELRRSGTLSDPNREFILEHNFYWPDFNLYLSKVRQGYEGRLTALERYTSEKHNGSLIQEFYVVLGLTGKVLGLNPNYAYQLGRIILSPLLSVMVLVLVFYFFRSFWWRMIAFIMVMASGSFPRFYTPADGALCVGRFMEWWSNIDAVQRTTFLPHILFGQLVSFFLLYKLVVNPDKSLSSNLPLRSLGEGGHPISNFKKHISRLPFPLYNFINFITDKYFIFIILANLCGLVFPPSLITLNGVILLYLMINIIKLLFKITRNLKDTITLENKTGDASEGSQEARRISVSSTSLGNASSRTRIIINRISRKFASASTLLVFFILSLPSLLYILILTRRSPWSALVEFHRTHPMMIPFWDYILGTGPVFFLGLLGAVVSVIKRESRLRPLIYWVIVTFAFALLFTHVKEQSPLRFTQTGLFIPLGILGTYFFQSIWKSINHRQPATGNRQLITNIQPPTSNHSSDIPIEISHVLKAVWVFFILIYISFQIYMMTVSLKWQTTFITQRANATIPPVPYPPQTMYPLKTWMDGMRWLRANTSRDDVVIAAITAGSHIPAYSGNTVYFGQSNTVDYVRKELEVDRFFKGGMSPDQASIFLHNGRIRYIFFSLQERELAKSDTLTKFYPFLKEAYRNPDVVIYKY